MKFEIINPESLGAPRGWSHGILAPRDGRLLFVAGQAGWESGGATAGAATRASAEGRSGSGLAPGTAAPPGFVDQFARALDKVLTVVQAAGGRPTDVARLTVYVTDLAAYRASLKPLGEVWRARFGKYYPAMALVEVKGLVDHGALVEMEATAVVGGSS